MSDPTIVIGFGQPFEAAIEEAHALGVLLPEEYYALKSGEYRRAATTVSGLTTLEQIQAVVDSFDRVIGGGQSVDEWVRWALEQNWGLSRARLETIIRTNVQTAYAAGQWLSYEKNKKFQPYLMWSAINDSRVRPAHLAMDGYIAHVDDPIWKVWRPPAGYNCRCTQIALTEKQALARGYGKQIRPDVQPDPGFGGTGGVLDALKGVIAKLKALCESFAFAGSGDGRRVWCFGDGESALSRLEGVRAATGEFPPPRALDLPLLPTGLPDKTYLSAFMNWFKEKWNGEAIVAGASGHQLAVSQAMFTVAQSGASKLGKRGRAEYVNFLAATIIEPDQVWLDEVTQGPSVLRFLSRFLIRGKVVGVVAVFRQQGNVWEGITAYQTHSEAYLASLRQGILVFTK